MYGAQEADTKFSLRSMIVVTVRDERYMERKEGRKFLGQGGFA